MRRVLLVLLGFGVFAGYGSAIASARWHARHHGEGAGCESRWGRTSEFEQPRPAAAPVPQTVVVPQAAPAAVPAQQIFLIMPGAQAAAPAAAPQVITIPVPSAAPAAVPANP